MTVEQLTETGILVLLRTTLFFSCRKYLLRNLYADLQDLSGVESNHRDPLPSPITQPVRELPRKAPQGKTSYSAPASAVFAGCFSESCLLFLLLMLQGMNVLSPSARLFNWRLSLFLLLACTLILVPLVTSLLLTASRDPAVTRPVPRIVFSTICVALYLLAFSFIPLPGALVVSDNLSTTLARLIVLGTLVLGLLSGFGAVSSSWAFLPSKNKAITPTEQDVSTVEYALSSIRDDLERRQEEVRRKEAARAATQQGQGTWMSRVIPNLRADEDRQELKGLETLEYEMTRKLDNLRHRRAIAKFSNTLRGKLFNIGRRFFAVYCVLRYLSCVANILFFFPRALASSSAPASSTTTSYPDIVTSGLANVLQQLWPEVQLDAVARATRHVSLVFVGVIILSSVRRVLRGVTRALRLPGRAAGASLMLLLLAQIMVIYLLSTLVQLRASFPPPSPSPTLSADDEENANLFSTIPDFQSSGFSRLFDWAFFVSASGALGVRWVGEKLSGPPD